LNTRLFKRSTRQLALTEEGRMFLDKTSAALDILDEALECLHEHRGQAEGIISIATATGIGKDHLLQRLLDFLDRHPLISLEVRFDDSRVDLIKDGYDLAVQFRVPLEQTYIARELCDLPLVLVASPGYLTRRGVPRSVAELAEHECITVRQNSGQIGSWIFQQSSQGDIAQDEVVTCFPTGRLLIAGEYDAVLDAALAGHGITATYGHSVLRYLKTGELKVVLPGYRVTGRGMESSQIYLCYPHREHLSYSVRTLIDYLVDSFRDFQVLDIREEWIA
jgi:LysR family transcriptional regulator, transcriptional activator for dmlA